MEKNDRQALAAKAALEYSEKGFVSHCPICDCGEVTTQGYVYGNRGSVSIICQNCGLIAHFDGLADMHSHADPDTVTVLNGG